MIATYADLQSEIAEWMNRSDLTGRIPTLIALAEAEIGRRLRRRKVRATVGFNAQAYPLPAAVAELASVRLVTGSPTQDRPLRIVSKEVLDEMRARRADVTGRPTYACVVGSELLLSPTPDQPYDAEVVYFDRLVPLSDANTTNVVLQESPDLYLWGALKHAEKFMEHDERAPMWKQDFEEALSQLNALREREENNASLRPARLPVVFG